MSEFLRVETKFEENRFLAFAVITATYDALLRDWAADSGNLCKSMLWTCLTAGAADAEACNKVPTKKRCLC